MNSNSAVNHCQTTFSAYYSLKTPLASLLWGINRHKVPMGTQNSREKKNPLPIYSLQYGKVRGGKLQF